MNDIIIFNQDNLNISLIEDKENETLWANQKQISEIFDTTKQNISQHIQKIFEEKELNNSVVKKKLITASDGKKYQIKHYNLDMIIAVGYKVNSKQATQFRQWATKIIREFTVKGAVIDPNRVNINEIAKQLRKLRVEEKEFYKNIRNVFKISANDYYKDTKETQYFFANVQDKFLYAITNKVSAQIILNRADATKPNMGLTNFKGVNYPTTLDIILGKNYLYDKELEELEILSENFLGFCQLKAFRGESMNFEEITHKVNSFLEFNGYKVLYEYNMPLRKKADIFAKQQQRLYKKRITIENKKNSCF